MFINFCYITKPLFLLFYIHRMINFEKLNISSTTKRALSSFNIKFVFQPIFDRSNQIVAYEALMRPFEMTVSDLIRFRMEKSALHEMELATFFGAIIAYKERNFDSKIKLHINSFPSECFTEKESIEYFEKLGIDNVSIVIEILEYMSADDKIWKAKKALADYYNINFALDDFGTGYSGLGAVDFYQPSIIKIDRSLISGINTDSLKQKNLNKFLKLFHSQNRQVLAEGIETKAEYEYLLSIGIDLFQGYYLGMPS